MQLYPADGRKNICGLAITDAIIVAKSTIKIINNCDSVADIIALKFRELELTKLWNGSCYIVVLLS